MILELVSFIGTSVGGNILGHVGRLLQGRSDAKARDKEQTFQQSLAD